MWMHSNQHTVYYCCKFFVSSSVTQKDIHTKMILHSLHIFLYWQTTQTVVCEFTTRSREMITVHLWFKYTRINMQKSTIEKQPTTISHKNTSRMSRLISPPSVTHTETCVRLLCNMQGCFLQCHHLADWETFEHNKTFKTFFAHFMQMNSKLYKWTGL